MAKTGSNPAKKRARQRGRSKPLDFDDVRAIAQSFLTRANPDVYYLIEHYRKYPFVLIRFALADRDAMREHFEDAWRSLASRRQIAEYESQSVPSR